MGLCSIARLNLKFNYPSCNGRRVSRFPEHPSQIQTPKQFACDPSKAPNAKENPHERSVSHSRSSYSGTARKPFHAMVNVILPEIKKIMNVSFDVVHLSRGYPSPRRSQMRQADSDKPGEPGLAWLNTTHVDALCAWCLTTAVVRTWVYCFSSG